MAIFLSVSPWEPTTLIFGGYNPKFLGLKTFMFHSFGVQTNVRCYWNYHLLSRSMQRFQTRPFSKHVSATRHQHFSRNLAIEIMKS